MDGWVNWWVPRHDPRSVQKSGLSLHPAPLSYVLLRSAGNGWHSFFSSPSFFNPVGFTP